ncbi:MAG: Rpn family recombination-promoting nuclease/putative transposase [Tannerella sp.]|jgi:predicted transposase/invertase (TIGR01784 family)|nr:Rpn family recombination-promoting nuclease/putative transposase [Tannerella sp.]
MAAQRKKSAAKSSKNGESEQFTGWGGKPPRYINPHTDFGFKRLFGTEANKDLLQEFLPVLLGREDRIISLRYMNPEQLGRTENDRKAVYDLYCETETGEKFIVEMQRSYQEFFKDRSVYYSTFPIQEQAKRGIEWDFELNAVYTVGILNFEFRDGDRGFKQYPWLHHVRFSDTETGRGFYEKLTYVYLELPKFTKTEDKLETLPDKWMFVLKNLAVLDDRPKALQERVFHRLFRIAEIEQLSESERLVYRESQKIYWDYMNTLRSAEKKGREKEALEKDAVIREKDAIIKEKDIALKEKDTALQEKDATIQEKEAALREKEENEIATVKNLFGKGLSAEEISEIMRLDIRRISEIMVKI